MTPFETTGAIKTIAIPNGTYTPRTDDLAKELVEAAKAAGINGHFKVMIDGLQIPDPTNLPTNSIAAIDKPISVMPYYKAA